MKNSTQILHIALTEPYCIKGLTVISTPTTGIITYIYVTFCKFRKLTNLDSTGFVSFLHCLRIRSKTSRIYYVLHKLLSKKGFMKGSNNSSNLSPDIKPSKSKGAI